MQDCTESPGGWEPDQKLLGKWTAEGAVKREDFLPVFCDVMAYVSCRGYVSIHASARFRESRWHRG